MQEMTPEKTHVPEEQHFCIDMLFLSADVLEEARSWWAGVNLLR